MQKEELVIIKELDYPIEGSAFVISGRILQKKSKRADKLYYGWLSHYWKPSELAGSAYRPSFSGYDLLAVERSMEAHIKTFKPIGVVENEQYDTLKY